MTRASLGGVSVELTTAGDGAVVLFVDTERDGIPVRIRLNDAIVYAGTIGHGEERFETDADGSLYVAQGEVAVP